MANLDKSISFSSAGNWADDVEAEEAEHGQAPAPIDILRQQDRPSYAVSPRGPPPPRQGFSPRGGGGGGGYGRLPVPVGPLPENPPFKVYLGNIPYDLDEPVVEHFFKSLKIQDIIITRHSDTGRAKGCFVEFATQGDLAAALRLSGADMLRRAVNIQLAEPSSRDGPRRRGNGFFEGPGRGGGGGGRMMDDRGGGGGGFRGGPPHGGGGYHRFDDDRGPPGRWTAVREVPATIQVESPRERPKLLLKPRAPAGGAEDAGDAGEGVREKVNPFGAAKPANTAAKLQELEEREKQRRAEGAAAKGAVGEQKVEERKPDAEQQEVKVAAPSPVSTGELPAVAVAAAAAVVEERQPREPREHREPREPREPRERGRGGRGGREGGREGRERRPERPESAAGSEGGRPPRREREGGREGGGSRVGRGSGGRRRGGEGGAAGEDVLPHHKQGDSGRGRGGDGRGRGRGGKHAAALAAAKLPAKVVNAPGEDDAPKVKVSNPFDLLNDE